MYLIPYEKFEIHSTMTCEEVYQVLKESTPVHTGIIKFGDKTFHGIVEKNSFALVRNVPYWNSLQPVLRGKISQAGTETVIKVTARMPMIAIIISAILMLFALNVIIFGFMQVLTAEEIKEFVIGAGILLLVYIFESVVFWMEIRNAKKILFELLG